MMLIFIGTALATAGAAMFGGGLAYIGGQKQNKAAREMAREQMRFQEMMSSTSYQRSMDDLRAAGLNPILAAKQGGAGGGAGASGPVINPLEKAVSSAQQVSRLSAEVASINAGTAQTKVDTEHRKLEVERFRRVGGSILGRQVDTLIRGSESLWNAGKGFAQKKGESYLDWLRRMLGMDKSSAKGLPPVKGKHQHFPQP